MTGLCPCGSDSNYDKCCGPFISGKEFPKTAEALMRSRYTAYTRVDIGYIKKTLAPEGHVDFDVESAKAWAEQSTWKGLKIISASEDTVEFIASYGQDGQVLDHHEISKFRKDQNGHWLFIDGQLNPNKK